MPSESASATKVSYDIRPRKQIQRRMLVESFQVLSNGGLNLRAYRYVGFGSIFFVDFLLMHKVLGISNLLSIEHDASIKKRVIFNRPFHVVDTVFAEVSDVLPTLDRNQKHILWLDYDGPLSSDMMADVVSAIRLLALGSFLIVTVDTELDGDKGPRDRYGYYQEECGSYFSHGWTHENFERRNLPIMNISLLRNAINAGLASRKGAELLELYKFVYKDGHRMVTFGGVVGDANTKEIIQKTEVASLSFIRQDSSDQPFEINLPVLTRKERVELDAAMPCADDWRPHRFNLTKADILAYREIYRYYPQYAELLLG